MMVHVLYVLKNFIKDDIIVWSKDPNCSHIHHKECMDNNPVDVVSRITTETPKTSISRHY